MERNRPKAPRSAQRVAVKYRNERDERKRGLGWRKANAAAISFIIAANDAHDSLVGISAAKKYIDWLKDEVIPSVSEYLDQLSRCGSDFDESSLLMFFRSVEEESIVNLLSFINDMDSDIYDEFNCDVSSELKNSESAMCDFVLEKMGIVKEEGWNMYHVFIGSV